MTPSEFQRDIYLRLEKLNWLVYTARWWKPSHVVLNCIGIARRSGVTRVAVTRGGNWLVSTYFFLKKSDDLILVIASESDDLF